MSFIIIYSIALVLFYLSTFFHKHSNLMKVLNMAIFFMPIVNICYYAAYITICLLCIDELNIDLNDRKDVRWFLNNLDNSYYYKKHDENL